MQPLPLPPHRIRKVIGRIMNHCSMRDPPGEAAAGLAHSHIALDWRCATNTDPFATDVHSVRPNSRRAFFMWWGCLCHNVGNYTLEECVEKARWAPRP